MSLNCQKVGYPFAQIKQGKWANERIYVNPDDNSDNPKIKSFTKLKIEKDDKGTFQLIPNPKKQRETIFVTGPSGVGKSYWIADYLREYRKVYKSNDMYLITNAKKEDPAYHDLPIQKIKIGQNLIEDPLNYESCTDSVMIFDDIDCIPNKDGWKTAIYELLNSVLEEGRKLSITCVFVQHVCNAGLRSRLLLAESNVFVYFPYSAVKNTTRAMETYFNVSAKQVKFIKSMKSRWAIIGRNPTMNNVCMTEKSVFILEDDD
jgi:hypothetical protein